jgi:chaperonin GroEL
MSKDVRVGASARDGIVKGINTVADIVKTTVGPRGRNVIIRNQISKPIITNDGVTIAKSIQLKDNTEDAGAQLIIDAANRTNDVAGDGTTTTTILAQNLIKTYYEMASEDTNVIQTRNEMLEASEEISDYLKSIATPIQNIADIERVATISSGSANTGKILAEAFEQAGEYGSVIVEDSKTGKDNLISIQGMKLTNGSVSSYLLSDRINGKSDMVDVNVLVTKDKIDSVADFFGVLDYSVQNGKKLLVICDDIEFEPLNMVLMNKAQGRLPNIAIIRLPGFADLREKLVEDICIATGATLMGRDNGITMKDFDPVYLGELEQVIVTMDDTVLKFKDIATNGNLLVNERQARVAELEIQMEKCADDMKSQFERRISNLMSGISIVQVGGNSDVEIKEKRLRIEDAINAVQSAKEEGIVPGGGYSFLMAYMNVVGKTLSFGASVVYKSLLSITRQIAENCGKDGNEVVQACLDMGLGYNAMTDSYEDLMETGVINSVKVDRYGLINATSVASTAITMGGSIVEENEPESNVLQLQAPLSTMM